LIPAFNESKRLPPYLSAIQKHFSRQDFPYEVIVVDDGSTDGTHDVLERLSHTWPQLRHVRHRHNEGRGQAIRTGHAAALGTIVGYVDADGATPIEEEAKLRLVIENGADVAIGSRVIQHNNVSRCRAFHRGIIGKVFSALVKTLVKIPVQDTQCGFKMWRREVASAVLVFCEDKGWLLDVEFLALANRLGYQIAEVPVTWNEISGSKVNLVRDSWRMFVGLWRIRSSLHRNFHKIKERLDANDETVTQA